MRGLQTAQRLQSWSPQHTYDTKQDNTTDYLTLIHSYIVIVNTNYIFNNNLKYLQSIESIEIYCNCI
jgi:hypothetical protein